MNIHSMSIFIFFIIVAVLVRCSYDYGYDHAISERITSYERTIEQLRTQERKAYKDQADLEAKYIEQIKEIKDNEAHLLDGYRANNLKLRESLKPKQCNVSATTNSPSSSDAEAASGLQDTDVTFLIRLAARADAAVEQLAAAQQIITNDRELCNVPNEK